MDHRGPHGDIHLHQVRPGRMGGGSLGRTHRLLGIPRRRIEDDVVEPFEDGD